MLDTLVLCGQRSLFLVVPVLHQSCLLVWFCSVDYFLKRLCFGGVRYRQYFLVMRMGRLFSKLFNQVVSIPILLLIS